MQVLVASLGVRLRVVVLEPMLGVRALGQDPHVHERMRHRRREAHRPLADRLHLDHVLADLREPPRDLVHLRMDVDHVVDPGDVLGGERFAVRPARVLTDRPFEHREVVVDREALEVERTQRVRAQVHAVDDPLMDVERDVEGDAAALRVVAGQVEPADARLALIDAAQRAAVGADLVQDLAHERVVRYALLHRGQLSVGYHLRQHRRFLILGHAVCGGKEHQPRCERCERPESSCHHRVSPWCATAVPPGGRGDPQAARESRR